MYCVFIDSSATYLNHIALWQDDKLCEYLHETDSLTNLLAKLIKKTSVKLTEISFINLIIGPGSYTSLRVGISAVKALSYALKIPIITLDWLQIRAKLYPSSTFNTQLPIIHAIHDYFVLQVFFDSKKQTKLLRLSHNELFSFAQKYPNPLWLPIVLECKNFPKLASLTSTVEPLFISQEYPNLLYQIHQLALHDFHTQAFISPQDISPLYFGPALAQKT